ncbi:hypothetical protein [Brevundimonas sp. FT23042]|uniref:hypothetical protein n=1 Tax=Brevundimonas sp. FT23042 TaxID=3393749 RepID=UPI003B58AB6F
MSSIFLRMSVLFVLLGVGLGYWMGMTHNFIVSPVHAHINLLGWVSMFLYGLFYRAFPEAAEGRLPKVHLALAGLGLPVMMIGLTLAVFEVAGLMPVAQILLILGPTLVVLGMIVWTVIVFRATGRKVVPTA